MSLWGNKDDIASPGTVALSGLTVTGTDTFFANNYAAGDVIAIADAGGEAVISAIASETSLTLVSNTELTTGTLTGKAYTVSEKPAYVIDGDTSIDGDQVYGVSVAEMGVNEGKVTAITLTAAGTGYTARPTVTLAAPTSGTTATATAVGTVITMAVGDAGGSGYANGDSIEVDGGTGTSANATVTTDASGVVTALTIVDGGSYTVLPTLNEATTSKIDGSGDDALTVDLTIGVGSTITITEAGYGYTSAPAVTFGGAGGSGSTATATVEARDSERSSHAGWVHYTDQYTDSNGNTRQKAEVLVAMSTITGDGADDSGDVELPDS